MTNPDEDDQLAQWYITMLYSMTYLGKPPRDWSKKDREQAYRDQILLASFLKWYRDNPAEVEQAKGKKLNGTSGRVS